MSTHGFAMVSNKHRAPKPRHLHISMLVTMRVYRWLDQRKDGGLSIRPVDIEKKFQVTPHQSRRLRSAYLESRGVFYGRE